MALHHVKIKFVWERRVLAGFFQLFLELSNLVLNWLTLQISVIFKAKVSALGWLLEEKDSLVRKERGKRRKEKKRIEEKKKEGSLAARENSETSVVR